MVEKINNWKKDELMKGSLILFFMINLFNLLNYIFHFSMQRLLGPGDYGILAVLFSVVYIFSVPSEAIQNVVTRYVTFFNSRNQNRKIKFLITLSLKKSVVISILVFLLFLPVAYLLSISLKINFLMFVFTGIMVFFVFSLPIIRGGLQGRKKFFLLGTSMVVEGLIKVIFSVGLVLVGWKVYGAMSGLFIGLIAGLIMGFFFIKDILEGKEVKSNLNGIYTYSIPFFVSLLCVVLIYSLDVIFARLLFSPEVAGKYAVASIFGKMIFFATMAIGKAMFPLVSERNESGRETTFLLKKSFKIVALISVVCLFFFFFFPNLIINTLSGKQYADVSEILFIVGLALTLLSFTNLILLYGLSKDRIKKSSFSLLFFVILECVLFYIFRHSIFQFSVALLVTNILLLIYSVILVKIK